MAKIYDLSEETMDAIQEPINDRMLDNFMEIEMRGSKTKDLIKVSRLNAISESIAEKQGVVAVVVDEEILENLNEEDSKLILDDGISRIHYDLEKDVIEVNKCPTITISVESWRKYREKIVDAYEKAILIREQKEELEKEQKAAERAAKKKLQQ